MRQNGSMAERAEPGHESPQQLALDAVARRKLPGESGEHVGRDHPRAGVPDLRRVTRRQSGARRGAREHGQQLDGLVDAAGDHQVAAEARDDLEEFLQDRGLLLGGDDGLENAGHVLQGRPPLVPGEKPLKGGDLLLGEAEDLLRRRRQERRRRRGGEFGGVTPESPLVDGARTGQVRAEGGRAALRRGFGENVRHVRQIRGPEAGHDVVLVVLRRGAPEDLDQGAQLGRLDAALEPQGADAVGVHPEGQVVAQFGVRVDRLPAAEHAVVREIQAQGAEFLEVLLGAPAEVLEEFFVQRVVRQIDREPAVRLGERLDDQAGGSGLSLIRGVRDTGAGSSLSDTACF